MATNFRDKAYMAEEHKSSATALFSVGGVGFLFAVLLYFDVFPFRIVGGNKLYLCGILAAMFLAFIITGFVSLKSSKQLTEEASEEADKKVDLENWCKEHLSAEEIDSMVNIGDSLEQNYFYRMECILTKIQSAFPDLDEDFISDFADGFYPQLYDEPDEYVAKEVVFVELPEGYRDDLGVPEEELTEEQKMQRQLEKAMEESSEFVVTESFSETEDGE